MTLQRELTQFDDELREYCERVEAEPFDRRNRLAMPEKQEYNPRLNFWGNLVRVETQGKTRKTQDYMRVLLACKSKCYDR